MNTLVCYFGVTKLGVKTLAELRDTLNSANGVRLWFAYGLFTIYYV